MRYFLLIIFFSIFINLSSVYSSDSDSLTYTKNEKLKYQLHYGWINGGYAVLQINEEKHNQEKILHAKLHAKTSGITERLYHVSDIYESFFTMSTGLPELAIRNISEGKYRDYNEVEYFHSENYIISQKKGKVNVPHETFDIISGFYHLRNLIKSTNLKKDSVIKINTYFGDEVFPMIIRYVGNEVIETDLGEINCLKFMPVVETGRVFKTQDDMSIWFSNDENVIPIRVQFELFIGSLKCDLAEYSGLKGNLKFVD